MTVEFNWARNRLFDKESCENYLLLCLAEPAPRALVESVTVKPKHKWRPTPMDTVEMEKLGSRKLKLSAKETMTIAEKLYSKGFISYPRTETNQFSKEFELAPLVQMHTGHPDWGPSPSGWLTGVRIPATAASRIRRILPYIPPRPRTVSTSIWNTLAS